MSTKIDRLQDRIQQLKAENKTLVRQRDLLRAIRDEAEKDRYSLRDKGPLVLALNAYNEGMK